MERVKPKVKRRPTRKAEAKEEQKPERKLSGWVDEEGSRYLDEVDLLRLLNSQLRIKNLRYQADSMKQKAENIRMEAENKRANLLRNAISFEESAKYKEKNPHRELVKELGARYGVDFLDTNIVVDDDSGKIKFITPPED